MSVYLCCFSNLLAWSCLQFVLIEKHCVGGASAYVKQLFSICIPLVLLICWFTNCWLCG